MSYGTVTVSPYRGGSILSEDNIRLRVKPVETIESGFFKKSMVSEITLMLRDGKPRKTLGITEFIRPGAIEKSCVSMVYRSADRKERQMAVVLVPTFEAANYVVGHLASPRRW